MLFNRFKEYLNKQFKNLPDSREVNDFREELLGNLMSRAMELKEDKSLSEDQIFQKCIDSLGDYSDTLRKLSGNPIKAIRDRRFLRDVLIGLSFALFTVIIYVAASFVTGLWGMCAYIVFPAMAAVIYIYIAVKLLIGGSLTKRHALTGLLLASLTVLITVIAFFVTAFATPVGPGMAWVLFTFIPFLICAALVVNRVFFAQKKVPAFLIVLAIGFLCVAGYLLTGVTTNIWHPTWLIVLGGPLAALFAGIVSLSKKIGK